jgi:hypothetical protein
MERSSYDLSRTIHQDANLASHTEGNTRFIDEVALFRAVQDPHEANRELLQAKDSVIVYHTANAELKVEIRNLRELRGVVQHEN